MSSFFSPSGGIPGMAASSSSGPARSSNNIFVGNDGGSTTSLARILNITSGAPNNGGYTGDIFPMEEATFQSGIRRTTLTGGNKTVVWVVVAFVVVILAMLYLQNRG